MQVGHLNQKAHPILVFFVFSCIIIITGLLYTKNKAEATRDHLIYLSRLGQYVLTE